MSGYLPILAVAFYLLSFTESALVRNNVNQLTTEEILQLRQALASLKEDTVEGGYQNLASSKGTPEQCQDPNAPEEEKEICSLHGSALFPLWNRLLVVQAESALRRHGYNGGLPYLDWSQSMTNLSDIGAAEIYTDPSAGQEVLNSLFSALINDTNQDTAGTHDNGLFQQTSCGKRTNIAKQVMLALEQRNFCDFEVQFEIAQNWIHALTAGNELQSMASLQYTAFDPLFFLHHSNVDRIFAVWQALQSYRGLPENNANCALEKMAQDLSYLAYDRISNNLTRVYSPAVQVFDYKTSFHYQYDNLEFNGLNLRQLNRRLEENGARERVFVGFFLHGIGQSANIKFYICTDESACNNFAGKFYILGDELETSWRYDRLYKYEITELLNDLGLQYDDYFFIHYEVLDGTGNDLGKPFPEPTVLRETGTANHYDQGSLQNAVSGLPIRKDVDSLSKDEMESLRAALTSLQEDGTYANISALYGKPGLCEENGQNVGCVVHGVPTFLAWNRLFLLQIEDALLARGSSAPLPYWNWLESLNKVPKLCRKSTYYNTKQQKIESNPFFFGKIIGKDAVNTRDPQPGLCNNNHLYEQVLFALEQTNFCDFEIQFQTLHNAVHTSLGGQTASLDYSPYDPAFFLYHSYTDRLWAIWQELQRYRGLPYNEGDLAIYLMTRRLQPFDDPERNSNERTRTYSRPIDIFDYRSQFSYEYDTLEFNHMNIPELESLIQARKESGRVFAGFLLRTIGQSADVDIYIIVPGPNGENSRSYKAGRFSILKGELEESFTSNRLYKYDITSTVKGLDLQVHPAVNFKVKVEIRAVSGSLLNPNTLPNPTILFVPGTNERQKPNGEVASYVMRKSMDALNPQETLSLMKALASWKQDNSADGFYSFICPDSSYACSNRGSATFPQWNRLYTVQIEDALIQHSSLVGIPYMDLFLGDDDLPDLLYQETFKDPDTGDVLVNPWYRANLKGKSTFAQELTGSNTEMFNHILLALEQEDFCYFETQFQITMNTILAWFGGAIKNSELEDDSDGLIGDTLSSASDRIWAIWQELQRSRAVSSTDVNCALEQMSVSLPPFGAPNNSNPRTQEYSRPEDTFDYEAHFHYRYDDLVLAGLDIPALNSLIRERQQNDRVFAGFLLSGLASSVNIEFSICDAEESCFHGGDFTVLRRSGEMTSQFGREFKYEITKVLADNGVQYDDYYYIQVYVKQLNGDALEHCIIPEPRVIFVPGTGTTGNVQTEDHAASSNADVTVRKDVASLSASEIENLREALRKVQADSGPSGYQKMASFYQSLAPHVRAGSPDNACSQYGRYDFLSWNRLYLKQFEDALVAQGADLGIPYLDLSAAVTKLPKLVSKATNNPFHHGKLPNGDETTRPPISLLFDNPGTEASRFKQILLALEQIGYCDFKVQLEIIQNMILTWAVQGASNGMLALEATAYDPFFLIHHSNTDRIWAIWTELQQYRTAPSDDPSCDLQSLRQPMIPFNNSDNVNPTTRANSRPIDAFNYARLNYRYDNLNFLGMTIAELSDLLDQRKREDRIFAEFLLPGFEFDADISFDLCDPNDNCESAGTFAILGGSLEVPWAFDRMFKYDVTDVFNNMCIMPDSPEYYFKLHITAMNGTDLDANLIGVPSVRFVPGVKDKKLSEEIETPSNKLIRKDVNDLTDDEIDNLRTALHKMQQDQGPNGFEAIAGFQGAPFMCPNSELDHHACAAVGMPTLPHWHRLLTVQFEQALRDHGAHLGVPYWGWTAPVATLPKLFGDSSPDNPFYSYEISFVKKKTTREVKSELYNPYKINGYNYLYYLALTTLEEDNFCDFEVQYEILHNEIHALLGGTGTYSMATLDYSAFDPVLMIHHSSVDRIWQIWQELQKLRYKPSNDARCAGHILDEPLHPFNYPDINPNDFTRLHSSPSEVFDANRFGYKYDKLELNGHDVEDLNDIIHHLRDRTRIYLGFVLYGYQNTLEFLVSLIDDSGAAHPAGKFHVLGSEKEMPWAYERIFKYDVTDVAHDHGITTDHPVKVKLSMKYYNGLPYQESQMEAVIVERLAHADYDVVIIPVDKTNKLPAKIVVKKGIRIKFVTNELTEPLEDLGSYTSMSLCKIPPFSYNTYDFGVVHKLSPGDHFFVPKDAILCNQGRRLQITVEDE